MRLTDMLAELDTYELRGAPEDVDVTRVVCHSNAVVPGAVFVCIRGHRRDGHRFIDDAVGRGAAAVVVDGDFARLSRRKEKGTKTGRGDGGIPETAAVIEVPDTRRAYGLLCAAFAGHPARAAPITGITGTNGKTTTALFLDDIFRTAGRRTGLVTTVFTRIGDKTRPQRLTTPEAGELQSLFAQMRTAAVEQIVLEVSSHALQLDRLAGTELEAGVFTNLSRDHLDFHGGWRGYRRAKERLFSLLNRPRGVAVVNVDDAAGRHYADVVLLEGRRGPPGPRLVTYGLRRPADVEGRLLPPRDADAPFTLAVRTVAGEAAVPLPPPGFVHAYNALAAAAAAWAQGVPLEAVVRGLADARPPPGRFEEIRAGQPFRVYVDFAHNPTGLAHALTALRPGSPGRLLLVFGCKGDDGDEWKRRFMGRIAARYADEIYVTTDNPLHECPRRIARAVARGVVEGGVSPGSLRIVLDRAEAIRLALGRARPGDAVLIAGRGHEREQRFGDDPVRLDDAAVARKWLEGRSAGAFRA